jgi:hypothetical protein
MKKNSSGLCHVTSSIIIPEKTAQIAFISLCSTSLVSHVKALPALRISLATYTCSVLLQMRCLITLLQLWLNSTNNLSRGEDESDPHVDVKGAVLSFHRKSAGFFSGLAGVSAQSECTNARGPAPSVLPADL